MAAPHVAGVVALLKSAHPDWTPAMIRSAILTTANPDNNVERPIEDEQVDEYAGAYSKGAGHVNATRATDPGMVYDLDTEAYATLICQRFGQETLRSVARNASWSCEPQGYYGFFQLNYPTIMVPLLQEPYSVYRTLTSVGPVGPPGERYKAVVDEPADSIQITVWPDWFTVNAPGEKHGFVVTVNGKGYEGGEGELVEATVTWVSEHHSVRSPLLAVVGLPHP